MLPGASSRCLCWATLLMVCLGLHAGCGVVPSKYAHMADWTASKDPYTADGNYYFELSERMPRTYLVNKIIYIYSGGHVGQDV